MNPGVSVVICCHNSAKRLPETLRHLTLQQVPASIPWEVVVIDNASTDSTAAVAVANWPAQAPAPLRVIAEPQAGLGHARVRGIREARHEIISFIDDDNWTASDWVKRVESIFASHPEVGACGGRSDAVTEITPPSWFEPIKRAYAVGSQHLQNGDVTDLPGSLLWGAGLSMRTIALRQLLDDGFVFLLSGRKGNRLLAGEDTEICFALWASGWRFWYDDTLALTHFISEERLQWEYARRLLSGMGNASVLIELYLFSLRRPPFDAYSAWKRTWTFQFLKSLRKLSATFLSHPIQCSLHPEGAPSALQFALLKTMASTLWQLRKSYREIGRQIAGSLWVRPSKTAQHQS